LAVILGHGTSNLTVLELANKILADNKDLELDLQQLTRQKGIGIAKACNLLAALELGERKLRIDKLPKRITSLSVLGDHLINKIGSAPQEKLIAVYLDNSYHLISEKTIFIGTIDSATVHPRDIIREALNLNAYKVIVAHNHPSAVLSASKNDKLFSLRLDKCCQLMGIGLVDHLIITNNSFLSMKSKNLI
jgi:DNA repair protein radc